MGVEGTYPLLLALWLVPLACAIALWAFGPQLKTAAGPIGAGLVGVCFAMALFSWPEAVQRAQGTIGAHITLFSWGSGFDFGLLWDPLALTWTLIITGVGFLIITYAIGYMEGDGSYPRFFAYMTFFVFAMLTLVLSDDFVGLLVGWGLVGLASFFLIGYYLERPTAVAAARKAFVLNVVGDVGIMFAIFVVVTQAGSTTYAQTFARVGQFSSSALLLVCIGLFIGCAAKSAQVPLHSWLPDAMEGPTPISALIHAATMVTAGVFMVARLAPLYHLSPVAMDVVAVVGALTMVLGATIALTQTDIKRVVAYSTVSQLGYMMMACGLGAYAAGMYHLLTHGAFKALLFLGCGSVIIALHHEQDMRRMGGLKAKLPITYWTFVVGSLALAGFPLTAGFFSKDALLLAAWSSGALGQTLSVFGLLTALLTAFYSFRLVFVTFCGPSRIDPHLVGRIHEPSKTMTVPLLILAVLSVATGYLGIPEFLAPVFPGGAEAGHHGGAAAIGIMAMATLMGLAGIAAAYYVYVKEPGLPDLLAARWKRAYQLSLHKWYVDELYDASIVRPTFSLADGLWKRVDVAIIDGAVNGVARAIAWGGWLLRLIQSGQTQHYALGMAAGAVALLTVYLLF